MSKLDRRWSWRFAGMSDLFRLLIANVVASLAFVISSRLLTGAFYPASLYCLDFVFCLTLMVGAQFSVRLYIEGVANGSSKNGGKAIFIYGAGEAGAMLVREMHANPRLNYRLIGFLDDDHQKHDTTIMGVPVLGSGSDATWLVQRSQNRGHKIEEIIIAIPSATGKEMRQVLANCRLAGVACRTMPGMGELLEEKILIPQIRNISVNDLLSREPVQLNEARIRSEIAGQSVLVTGAAGSIGSELCRQLAALSPRRLIAFDQAESELFKTDLELRGRFSFLDLAIEVGDIRDAQRVEDVMREHAVDCVFHAAAYKHVPLMETSVREAVKNNILGTWNVAQAAYRNRVSGFLMISTDKAVNPANVMGATKRVAELITSSMVVKDAGAHTKFVSVRFGNVLGSNGSVVPIFQAQIATGGPVTVTHPDARRYFMTIREAVQLVLQAYTMGKDAEIFVLDMGEPVRIEDMARNMIRLSGLVPDEDIEIKFTGLRPGEKLFEEIATEGENVLPTYHEKIKIFQGVSPNLLAIEAWIDRLKLQIEQGDEAALIAHIQDLVPEYQPAAKSPLGPFVARAATIGSGS
jgi:FlaA1/EpsC-like NDP-sugar epimerase